MNKVLVIAAHSDDEIIGCGGTLTKHIEMGDDVNIVFMTNGVSSRTESSTYSDILQREQASKSALSSLGITNIHRFSFPDNKMDSIALLDITQAIESVINTVRPNVIYTHFINDLNIDHQITHKAVMTACRPQSTSCVDTILSFEVLSSTEWNSPALESFKPQYIVDISKYWNKKLAALKYYDGEMRDFPHSRSYECIEALAVLRGASHGFSKAEAFQVERILKS